MTEEEIMLDKLKAYLEDNIQFEAASLRRAIELDEQIHRGANLSTFRRILKFLEVTYG